ncbi:unnamed protein product, partial [Onchocerca flexuosa]|uniref:Uncharacterized protein n=1 Tax=Onchocerca flexuosa TaxID=387005 RepID=A0A183HFS3_9BILA
TTTTVATTITATDFDTGIISKTSESVSGGTNLTDITPVVVIATTITSTTISPAFSSSPPRSIDFGGTSSTTEPKSFPFTTSSIDYHFRKVTPAKKFKFAQKFRRQPRLKIRKQDEIGRLRGNQTASGRSPIILPHLAPLNLENEIQQIDLDNDENG